MRCVLVLLGLLLTLPVRGGAEEVHLTHAGADRHYVAMRPAGEAPTPALLVLHGSGGGPAQILRHTGFGLHAEGWTQLYPAGLDKVWNDGRRALAGGPLRTIDDLGFLEALLDRETAKERIDPERIYVAGTSNGGAMTQRLLCQAPERVAGAAVVIMNFPVGLDCPPSRPIPILFILGTEDPLIPFMGGPITVGKRDRGAVMPAPDTLAFYAARNGCGGLDQGLLPDLDPEDGMRVRRLIYRDCTAPVEALIVEGGGHTWPGARDRPALRRLLGPTARDISATREIEDFFRRLAGR